MSADPAAAHGGRRERVVITAALLALAALAWVYLWYDAAAMSAMDGMAMDGMAMDGMAMGGASATPWDARALLLTFLMWTVMMAGMMLPSAIPAILLYATLVRSRPIPAPLGVAAFTAGYLALWTLFSLAATLLQAVLQSARLLSAGLDADSAGLAAVLLVAAGAYQWLPWKQACLRHCRDPLPLFLFRWRAGAAGAFRMGAGHGAFCVGCCWALMLVLFAVGVMDLLWVALLAALVLIEKLLPLGIWFGRVVGTVFLVSGAMLLLAGCAAARPVGADLQSTALLSRYDWQQPLARWALPSGLAEVSGLADDGSGGLLTHDDNDATLWRLQLSPEFTARRLPGAGAALDADFEAIARRDASVLLLTSPGHVYRTGLAPGAHRLTGPLTRVATDAGGRCGFEGMAAPPDGSLYLACKYPREPRPGFLLLYRLAPDGTARPLAVDVRGVLGDLGLRRLRPSGLAWSEAAGRLLVLAGKERVLLEVDPQRAAITAWRRLQRRLHRQAEGLALLPDGVIAIADEADGRTARLTLYGAVAGDKADTSAYDRVRGRLL